MMSWPKLSAWPKPVNSFLRPGQHRLKVWRLLLPRHDAYLNFLEADLLQPSVQITFGKAEPAVSVKLVGSLEIMLQKVQNQNLAMRLENFIRPRQRLGWLVCVM